MFYFELGDNPDRPIKYRHAVRAVIFFNDKLLMVKSNRQDYKFPGGGVLPNEEIEQALIRETLEETGYKIVKVIKKIGENLVRNVDYLDESYYFVMKSEYFLCEINGIEYEQHLDDYEVKLDFCPCFKTIDEAIENNNKLLNEKNKIATNFWLDRETMVLQYLKDNNIKN